METETIATGSMSHGMGKKVHVTEQFLKVAVKTWRRVVIVTNMLIMLQWLRNLFIQRLVSYVS